jgi:ribosome-associated translation inhibitor RaiA
MDSRTTPISRQDLEDIEAIAHSVPSHSSYSLIYGGSRTPRFEVTYNLSGEKFSASAEHNDLYVAACLAARAAIKHAASIGCP